jgi:hypothetical protein
MGTGADDVSGTASLLRPGGLDGNRAEGFNHNLIQFRSAVRAIAISGKLFIAQGDNHQGYGPTRIDKSTTPPSGLRADLGCARGKWDTAARRRADRAICGRGCGPLCGWRPAWVSQPRRCTVYLSVTAPPVNFREAYSKDWSKAGPARMAMKNRP